MRRIKVLFLSQEGVDSSFQRAIVAAVGDHHDLMIYDTNKPLKPQFKDAEVVLDPGGSVGTHEMMDAAKDTLLWQILGTGLDHVDVEYMKSKGFVVSNCPGQFSSFALAECAMMFILMLSRRIFEAMENFNNRMFYNPSGFKLEGKVLGIVGFGSSGQELARRAKPFGMRIMGIDIHRIEQEVLDEIQPEFIGSPSDLDTIVKESDFLSLHLHLTENTRHIIDARRIGMMKPDAYIINVARGALVDESAMHEALLNGKLGGAGIDVFSQEPPDPNLEVYQLPNVVVTPHISGNTDGTLYNRAGVAIENCNRIAQGQEPLYPVNK